MKKHKQVGLLQAGSPLPDKMWRWAYSRTEVELMKRLVRELGISNLLWVMKQVDAELQYRESHEEA